MTNPAKSRKRKREKTTLYKKDEVVKKYFEFVGLVRNTPKIVDIFQHQSEYLRSEMSIKSFLKEENISRSSADKLDMANMFKWIKASYRGDFLPWGNINDLTKCNAKSKNILVYINDKLLSKFPLLCKYQRVVRSLSSPDQYGVIARTAITAGSFLGFFEGELCTGEKDDQLEGPHKYTVIEGDSSYYIDCTDDFLACYARYYNCSTKIEKQNVSVVRLAAGRDHNHTVCFIANADIEVNHELIIGPDQGYLRNGGVKRYSVQDCLLEDSDVESLSKEYVKNRDELLAKMDL